MDAEQTATTEWGHRFRPRREAVEAERELPTAPPPGVMDEIARASRRYDELGAAGHRLHFELERGGLRVELRDLDGNVLRQVSPAEALAVAVGAAP